MIISSEVTRFLESSKKNKINNIAIIIDAYIVQMLSDLKIIFEIS